MGRSGHLLSPAAEQDAYPLNWPPVTIQTSKHWNRVLHRRAIDAAMIAVDTGIAQKSTSNGTLSGRGVECDFAVKHEHKQPPRTFAPKFGGLWLMRRKHWFEL